jgi:ABC-type phosphate transport system ATPase subunit
LKPRKGSVLVTGPTGSGKSTTLYGAINYLNKEDSNILTAGPIEYTSSWYWSGSNSRGDWFNIRLRLFVPFYDKIQRSF